MKNSIIVWVAIFCAILCADLSALPESQHPYPNNCDDVQTYTCPGALAIEVTFCKKTATQENRDFIILSDTKEEISRHSGKSLAGKTILVMGDTFQIRLVSDQEGNAYGYRIEKARSIFSRNYFANVQVNYEKADTLVGESLKDELYNLVKNHVCLGYTPARQKMFGEIDNENGYVRCVYTGRLLKTTAIPNGSDMNTEHTWPKSMGASSDPAMSDLFHLFITDSETNSRRSSYPFGMVVEKIWEKGGSVLGKDEQGSTVFMVRPDHRGNVARAMFYFSIRYKLPIEYNQEKTLRQWHQNDPVDDKEKLRNDGVANYQKNRNPFIDHPEYVERITDF